jgi:hypothetical protein
MFARFEALVLGWLVRRLVRRQLKQLVEATSRSLIAEIPGASVGTLLSLLLPQETLQTATETTESPSEAETGLEDADDLSGAYSAEPEEIPAEPEPDAAERRRALAAVLNRSEPRQDFAELLLRSRGAGWE